MVGLKAPVSGIEEGGWHRLMGGNEGELDAPVFVFWWRHRGDRGGGVRPAGCSAMLGFGAGGRRSPVADWAVMVGWAGREAKAQWGGEGKLAGWKKRNGPRLGRKARWFES
jgi:hypothetical protein